MTYEGDNPLLGHKPLQGQDSLYTTKQFLSSKMNLLYDFAQLKASNICKRAISKPC